MAILPIDELGNQPIRLCMVSVLDSSMVSSVELMKYDPVDDMTRLVNGLFRGCIDELMKQPLDMLFTLSDDPLL